MSEEEERPARGLIFEGAATKALLLDEGSAALTRVRAKNRLTMTTESAAAWVKKRLEQRRRIDSLVTSVQTTRSESRAQQLAPTDSSEPSPSRAGSSTPGRRVAFRGSDAADARPRSASSQVTVDLPEVAVRSGSLYLEGSKVESAFQKV